MMKLRNLLGAVAFAIASIFVGTAASQAAPMPAAGIVADVAGAKSEGLVQKTHGGTAIGAMATDIVVGTAVGAAVAVVGTVVGAAVAEVGTADGVAAAGNFPASG